MSFFKRNLLLILACCMLFSSHVDDVTLKGEDKRERLYFFAHKIGHWLWMYPLVIFSPQYGQVISFNLLFSPNFTIKSYT